MNTRLLFLHALSPLHAGTGQGVGVIDLPIAREKATAIPYVPGSTVKGVLRDAGESAATTQAAKDTVVKVFGPPTDMAELHAGSLQISDARLLLLPTRSVLGTFAWVTSPYLLHRLVRDLETIAPAPVPIPNDEQECHVAQAGSQLLDKTGNKVYLEDLDLTAKPDEGVTNWAEWLGKRLFPDVPVQADADATTKQRAVQQNDEAQNWRKQLSARLCVVHDNVLAFLLDTATEVRARIKMDDNTKTVQEGGLWYEEALPTETVLVSLALAAPVRGPNGQALTPDAIFTQIEALAANPLQFGGKATVGYGVCNVRLSK